MTQASKPISSAAWRRAVDELLIDAIFGSGAAVIRDGDKRLLSRIAQRPAVAPAAKP